MIQLACCIIKSMYIILVQVPRIYFTTSSAVAPTNSSSGNTSSESGTHCRLMSKVMRDFIGLDRLDDVKTTQALLDFSYYLTIGNMDQAYKAVRLIKNPTVWENMAHMCVKTKRLDVAEICICNMMYARGAAAVRQTKLQQPELEARIAQVSV
jgi:intraflagellar transport protein 140